MQFIEVQNQQLTEAFYISYKFIFYFLIYIYFIILAF